MLKDKVTITMEEYHLILRGLQLYATYLKTENDPLFNSDYLTAIRKLRNKLIKHSNKLVEEHNRKVMEEYEY